MGFLVDWMSGKYPFAKRALTFGMKQNFRRKTEIFPCCTVKQVV